LLEAKGDYPRIEGFLIGKLSGLLVKKIQSPANQADGGSGIVSLP
jgi:hypothetical protein